MPRFCFHPYSLQVRSSAALPLMLQVAFRVLPSFRIDALPSEKVRQCPLPFGCSARELFQAHAPCLLPPSPLIAQSNHFAERLGSSLFQPCFSSLPLITGRSTGINPCFYCRPRSRARSSRMFLLIPARRCFGVDFDFAAATQPRSRSSKLL